MAACLGAYHALNIALRHPWRFGKAVALSGRYDLTRGVQDFDNLLGGYWDDLVYFHTPNAFLPNVHEAGLLARLRGMEIVLAVGETDPFREDNDRLVGTLRRLAIPHGFHVWPGRAHCPHDWSRMVELYL